MGKIQSKMLFGALAAIVGVGVVAQPAMAAPGDLDMSFGNGGKITTNFPSLIGSGDIAYTSVIQSDGKIITAGRAGGGVTAPGRINAIGDFGLARYNTDGSLDTTFSGDGMAKTPFTIDRDQVRALAIQDDGKIVAAGFAGGELTGDFALARYHPDGSLDTTFGNGGKVTTDITGVGDGIRAIEILPNGKLLVAGAMNVNPGFAQYNPDGSLDTSFGNGGVVLANSDLGHFFDMKRLSNGKFIVVGSANLDFSIARFHADGSLDTTFGNGGATKTDLSGLSDTALSMAIRPNGKIVVSGWANGIDPLGQTGDTKFALAQYTSDGSLDASFGDGGFVTSNPTPLTKDNLFSIALQPDGKIVAGGVVGAHDVTVFTDPLLGDVAVARFTIDGSPDTTFGTNGLVTTSFSQYGEEGLSVALQPDGKIVLTGGAFTSATNLDFVLARFVKN